MLTERQLDMVQSWKENGHHIQVTKSEGRTKITAVNRSNVALLFVIKEGSNKNTKRGELIG